VTRYFALAINSNPITNPKAVTLRQPKGAFFRVKNPGIWLTVFLFVFGVAYLLQTSSVSTRGYEISKLETRLSELRVQNEKLEIEARAMTTIESIESQTRTLNLVPAAQASHIRADSNFSYQR